MNTNSKVLALSVYQTFSICPFHLTRYTHIRSITDKLMQKYYITNTLDVIRRSSRVNPYPVQSPTSGILSSAFYPCPKTASFFSTRYPVSIPRINNTSDTFRPSSTFGGALKDILVYQCLFSSIDGMITMVQSS